MKNTNLLATFVAGLTLLCLWLPAKAQHPCQEDVFQNSLWSLPDLYAQFPDNGNPPQLSNLPIPPEASPTPDPFDYEYYSGYEPSHAHNAIHDQNGNLKFFVVDDKIFDRNGYGIYMLRSSDGDVVQGNAEICIVPDPANCERYHIFASNAASPTSGNYRYPFYSLLDVSLPSIMNLGAEGAPVFGTESTNNAMRLHDAFDFEDALGAPINLISATHQGYSFAATKLLSDGTSRLVFVSEGGSIYRLKVDENGVTPINPKIYLGDIFPSIGNQDDIGKTEFEVISLDNSTLRLGCVFTGNASNTKRVVASIDVDENGDYISGTGVAHELIETGSDVPEVKGLEFSESGDYLYFTHHITSGNPNSVQYIDIVNETVHTLNVPNQSNFQYSQIEMAIDGNLYFAYEDGLASLEDPDNPNITNWVSLAISINDYPLSNNGFPLSQDATKAYLLPDQIDGMNYYDHFLVEEDLECCLHHPPYDAYNATATTSATWSPGNNPFSQDPNCDVVLISNELRIPSGVTITIQDMRFEFHENARVVIEPGGKLNMDNTLFTYGPCGDRMWLGVEVHGDPNLAQLPYSNQGYHYMKNNSVIEHAYVGAMAASRQGSTSSFGNLDDHGGVIRAFNSRFRNNQRDVLITDYQWPDIGNRCYFENCDFLTDNLLNHPEVTPLYHAHLTNVDNVKFEDCSFRNTASFEALSIENRGYGVFSYLATFRVNGDNEPYQVAHDNLPISDNVHQSFYQLRNGVLVVGLPNHAFTVSKMEFQRNKVGIVVLGSSYETITFNNFDIPEVDDNYPAYNYGAILINSYLFTVEENHFFGGPEVTRIAGLLVDNSCPDDAEGDKNITLENEVYRNQFTDLEIGILVENDNRDQDSEVGLQARCNEFSNNYRSDIYLADSTEWRTNQGALFPDEMLTNNVFSMGVFNCGIPYHDLRISPLYGDIQSPNDLTVDYHCFDYPPSTVPDMDVLHPSGCAQDRLILYTVDGSLDYEEHCPSNFSSGGGIKYPLVELVQTQTTAEANLASAKAVYQATIDGGDTEDIIDLLKNLLDEESAYLRDLLLVRYPLSKEALMAALDAANSFDPWHLTQVLVANAPLPGDVYSFVKDNQVLDPFFFQFVEDAQANGGVNLGRLLYSEISLRSYEKSQAERAIHRHYLHHADSLDAAAWNNYVESRDEPYYKMYRLGAHLDKGETGAAQSLLDSLKLNADSEDWFQFMIDLEVADTVTTADISSGWDFFYNAPATRGNVWGWLTAQGQLDSIPPLPPIAQPKSMSLISDEDKVKADRWLEAYPNPAKDRVVLTYPHEADGIGIVQLFNADGRMMKEFAASDSGFQEINLTGWPTGMYIAKLIVNDKAIDTVKINVVK